MKRVCAAGLFLFLAAVEGLAQNSGGRLDLVLPTENDALLRGAGPEFYQYVDRNFQGEKSTPWQGGRYGFVRNPKPGGSGLIYTKFHEGIDIRAVRRDESGEPLDEVRAIAPGVVVHTNASAGQSNYGRYVVVEHRWGGCSYYSLYGHLNRIDVTVGASVGRGERLGLLGYTGTGINKTRAHLHLELNLMMSRKFEAWHDRYFPSDPNYNGLYNGLNLAGLDIAQLYLALQKNPALTLPQFIAQEETFYRVALPDSANFYLRKAYPWMAQGGGSARAWEVSFARSGLPLRITPSSQSVSEPTLTHVKGDVGNLSLMTGGKIVGSGENARLTENARRQLSLLTYPD